MFAIEKNPSAVKILQIRNEDEWNGQVTVIHTDMRDWKPEEKLDIIISELLGKNKIHVVIVPRWRDHNFYSKQVHLVTMNLVRNVCLVLSI